MGDGNEINIFKGIQMLFFFPDLDVFFFLLVDIESKYEKKLYNSILLK